MSDVDRKLRAHGRAFKYGDNVDTDVIIPARYLNDADPATLAAHCMEDLDPLFAKAARAGDMIVAGRNFGCGSSREHAPIAIKAAGASCVIAESFARIFYRNAINIGLPILECPEAAKEAANGDEIEVDFASGKVRNATRGSEHAAKPFPPFMRGIIEAGGLIERLGASIAAQAPGEREAAR
jgi:3-isopropylmalate/(R)-2-methylmalate dehydratase small subunit